MQKYCELFIITVNGEGFGFSDVETMKVGIPVAVSDIPVHREIAEKRACYFKHLESDMVA
ncbi:MAG: glycosyltransferase [Cuniculiplasma sp.]